MTTFYTTNNESEKHLVTIALVTSLIILLLLKVHPFLAMTKPVESQLLVVEGWLYGRSALLEVIEEFKRGNYELIVVVGGPYENASGKYTELTTAETLSQELIKKGIKQKNLVVLPIQYTKRHRTLTKGLAIKEWLIESGLKVCAINIFTVGVHARKSQLIYQKALGSNIVVGVISGEEIVYDRKYWWLSIDGIRIVSRNIIGYVYALLIFTIFHG